MDAIDSDYKFAAHLPLYPPCFAEPSIIEFTDSPIHILIGELDEWVPADACVDLVDLMRDNNINVDITVYDGAHHENDYCHHDHANVESLLYGDYVHLTSLVLHESHYYGIL